MFADVSRTARIVRIRANNKKKKVEEGGCACPESCSKCSGKCSGNCNCAANKKKEASCCPESCSKCNEKCNGSCKCAGNANKQGVEADNAGAACKG